MDHAHHDAEASVAAWTASGDPFTRAMAEAMARMMAAMHGAPPSGDPDKDFLAMMAPHHQGAIEMARLLLLHGRDPLTRQLAEEIIAGQTIEVQAMQARLAALGTGTEEYPTLGGTRGAAPP
ncbi:DUF305 domain-containing protein [Plastoroseomonas hellenica]|uniref:DUF305 domain-containing protein n=1 Tax=Plastoroseomonas hellenica TaxID=2687306 RepID=UPI001BABEAD0|nr:DUF305 domain-containing protein [Plastoroseomonas hellenica]MBR0644527.1 DUF305 domain-containing protein [Plastoroseomonas hellenica]